MAASDIVLWSLIEFDEKTDMLMWFEILGPVMALQQLFSTIGICWAGIWTCDEQNDVHMTVPALSQATTTDISKVRLVSLGTADDHETGIFAARQEPNK